MNNYSQILANKYRNKLFNDILQKSDSRKILPLTEDCDIKKTTDIEYFRNMFYSFLNHLALLEEPIYKSRQSFLQHAYLDKDNNICFHLNTSGGSSTLMGGEQKDDEFYDPNWKTLVYNDKGVVLSRIIKNLKSRFYTGVNSNFYNYNSRKTYIKTISLESVSIAEFNDLFTPVIFSSEDEKKRYFDSFKSDISTFLKKIVVNEDFKDSVKEEDVQKFENETKNEKYNEIACNFAKEYIDEYGETIDIRPHNLRFDSVIEIGDILTFIRGEQRVITELKVCYSPIDEHYIKIYTKIKDFGQNDFCDI